MKNRSHSMPFGAELTSDGQVRFRLWAPAAQKVEVVLQNGAGAIEMSARADGFFEVLTNRAKAGSLYKYRIDGKTEVPDPASRYNPEDIHGASEVIDPNAFKWDDGDWRGRRWHEAIVYELHVGTFTPEGTFAGAAKKLDHLKELGVTAIELMPIADFPGKRGWGYDGVLMFAPESAYGRPEDLKAFVVAAHQRGLAVMLDVVYNHFGPEGNYLNVYAPQFFTEKHHTPWGAAINFDAPGSRHVRDFYINNTLYWLEEFHFDGLRYDAVHAIIDDSKVNVMTEIAQAARSGPGRDRHLMLVLENGANRARFLGPEGGANTFDAQWNDDLHHCLHTILTGEKDGYYEDYVENPHAMLCRCLAEGFGYQGQHSNHEGARRGEPSAHLPPTAFVNFLQNHDQIGNRAFGDRLDQVARSPEALKAANAILLLAPSIPMLFMGEEWQAQQPFPYFCDFEPELAGKVREGRKREFARFEKFSDKGGLAALPDPTSPDTVKSACLNWDELKQRKHADILDQTQRLLAIRVKEIVPIIPRIKGGTCIKFEASGAFAVDWSLEDGSILHLLANMTERAVPVLGRVAGRLIYGTHPNIRGQMQRNELAPWSVTWLLERSVAGP
jgi:maltooligosyltrehalose trehalohydrolase